MEEVRVHQLPCTVRLCEMPATAVDGHVTVRPSDEEWPVSVMLPWKLKVPVREMCRLMSVCPLLKLTPVAMIVKSPTCTIDEAEWVEVPGDPDPVIVATYVPAVVESRLQRAFTVALAVRLTAFAGQVTVRPVVGLTEEESLIEPEKSYVLVSVTLMAEPVAPVLKSTGELVEIVKSPT